LSEKLYFDENLSTFKNQSCATCHNTKAGFIDDRAPVKKLLEEGWPAIVPPPVSLGSDETSFGGRNLLSSAYAAFSPAFWFDEVSGLYVGEQFWDGREPNFAGQAAGPFRNPVEMAMPDIKAVFKAFKKRLAIL
jgi:cytochrome c peroxidase